MSLDVLRKEFFQFIWLRLGFWDLGSGSHSFSFSFFCFFGKDPLGPTRGAFQCCTCRPKANLLRFVSYFFRFPLRGFAFEPRLKFAEHRRGITPLTLLIFFVGLGLQFFSVWVCAVFWDRLRFLLTVTTFINISGIGLGLGAFLQLG